MTHRIERGDGWELHACDWRDAAFPTVDMVCEDPPYGARTHAGQRHARKNGDGTGTLVSDIGLQYDHITPQDVEAMMISAHASCSGWVLGMTSHDLIPAYEAAAAKVGRYCFAPLPIVNTNMNVRLAGDGPSNWTVHLIVTRTAAKKCWGTKPGAYITTREHVATGGLSVASVAGGKPVGLMEAILRDYTDPGDLVLDRFTGGGTTGVAAIRNGRRFVGYERKPEHFEIALKRLRAIREQRTLFTESTT